MAKGKKAGQKIVDMRGRLGAAAVLDELVLVFAQGDRGLGDASAVLQRGIHTFGRKDMVDELCRRLTRLKPDEDSTAIVWGLEEIGDKTAIEQMREIAMTPHLAPRVHTDAAIVLHALGEPIDLDALPIPASGDIHQVLQKILDDTERQLNQVEIQDRAFMLNELFDEISRFMGQENSAEMLRVLLQALKEQDKPVAPDMLWVLSEFSPEEQIREQARQGLEEMQWRNLGPNPDMVLGTYAGKYARGYISDTGSDPAQAQVIFAWEQQPDRLRMFSFLIDFAYWDGAVKDFFLKPSMQEEEFAEIIEASIQHGILMTEIHAAEARWHIARALQANIEQAHPLPLEYRRFHRLIVGTLFEGTAPVELPSMEDEAHSPLPAKAGAVEELLWDSMPAASFNDEQVMNARMLWRDFYQFHTPCISKVEVWAAAVSYVIGWIEGRRDQTQQVVAEHYGVSAASVSKRAGEIWDLFLNVEQEHLAYATEKARPDPEDVFEVMDDLLGEVVPAQSHEEELEMEYQEYLEEYEEFGAKVRQLTRAEFEQFAKEFDSLLELEEAEELSRAQSRRLRELEHLLLED